MIVGKHIAKLLLVNDFKPMVKALNIPFMHHT